MERAGVIREEIICRIWKHARGILCSISINFLIDILVVETITSLFLLRLLGTKLLVIDLLIRSMGVEPDSLLEVFLVDGLAFAVHRILVDIVILGTQVVSAEGNISVTILESKIVLGSHRHKIFSFLGAASSPSNIGERLSG